MDAHEERNAEVCKLKGTVQNQTKPGIYYLNTLDIVLPEQREAIQVNPNGEGITFSGPLQ